MLASWNHTATTILAVVWLIGLVSEQILTTRTQLREHRSGELELVYILPLLSAVDAADLYSTTDPY